MGQGIDYGRIATVYDRRYGRNDYSGVEQTLVEFVHEAAVQRRMVLEVGCGTGHWLRRLEQLGANAVGVDPSAAMLEVARIGRRCVRVIRARAEALPWAAASYGCLFCVNALHHFADPSAFFREARRVLGDGGGLLTIGLDPHNGQDDWWIYRYFPNALAADKERYLPTSQIRDLMRLAGFTRCHTSLIQHLPREMSVSEARAGGFLDRTSTSQLMVVSDADYESGLARIDAANVAEKGATMLRSDLRLYGTIGWLE